MQKQSSRPMTKLMITAAAGVMAVAGMAAPAFAAEHRPAERSTSLSAGVQAQTVTTWINGNVRIGPSTGYSIAYTVAANQNLTAVCWNEGGFVNANGVYHDKWVLLSDDNWIWGGLLKGNETGNVSNHC
ncbi:hypothetical protein [Streptomyces sp. NPDC060205]|uniref:hypothetical protein n=1 Tax=Streptomyces sp. NPDC060205 TaxID=3347072 RepID=UPI00365126E3